MSQINVKNLVKRKNFHPQYVKVNRVINDFGTLWNNLVIIALQMMPYYNNENGIANVKSQVKELQRFMILKALAGDVEAETISPSGPVDELWHILITFTKDYARLSSQLLDAAGIEVQEKFIHHNPLGSLPGDEANKSIRYNNTFELYKEVFVEDLPAAIWPHHAVRQSSATASTSSVPMNTVENIPLVTAVPVEEDNQVTLNISWTKHPDRVAHCQISPTTRMKQVFDDFMHAANATKLKFYLHDKLIKKDDTPESLMWIDGDTIIARN